MRLLFLLLTLLCALSVTAETFDSVEDYITHITNGQLIVGNDLQSSRGRKVFGTVRWKLPEFDPTLGTSEVACVFVLEKLKRNRVRVIAHSTPFPFPIGSRAAFEGLETRSSREFLVQLTVISPLSKVNYRFLNIKKFWRLVGRDEMVCGQRDDDEAQCDTRVERWTNYLVGKIIEKRFRKDKLASTKYETRKFPKFSLAEFKILDQRHGEF